MQTARVEWLASADETGINNRDSMSDKIGEAF